MVLIRWELAANEQLKNILAHDWDIPSKHFEGLINECLSRKLFDPLIKHLIHKFFPRWENERRYNFYDLYSIGYIGIVIAMKNYKPGKGSFKTFAYMNIQSEFAHHKAKIESDKRKVYENIVSLNVPKFDDSEEHSFQDLLVDYTQDPEEFVIRKLFWIDKFSKLSERERTVLISFSQGYTMGEIAKRFNLKSSMSIHRAFHQGINKINPHAGKVDVKALGLMNRTKAI
jgi:RNA polymerase sigma factor (sigma-70 family)